MTTKAMEFETIPFKTGSSKSIKNNVSDNALDKVSTGRIFWYLVRRHKFALVATWAVLITIQWAFPPAFDILTSLI